MSNAPYTSAGNPSQPANGGGMTIATGAKAVFTEKDDGLKTAKYSAAKTLVANVPLSNRTVNVTVQQFTTDTLQVTPIVRLFEDPKKLYNIANTSQLTAAGWGHANHINLALNESDNTSFLSNDPNVLLTTSGPTGVYGYFGGTLPGVFFTNNNSASGGFRQPLYMPFDQFGLVAGTTPYPSPLSGLLNWDAFAIVQCPAAPTIVPYRGSLFCVTDENQSFCSLGVANNQIHFMTCSGAVTSHFSDIAGVTTTIQPNQTTLLHWYNLSGVLHMRVNNLEQTLVPSGIFSQLHGMSWSLAAAGAAPATMAVGGQMFGSFVQGFSPFSGVMGSFRLYPQLSQANKSAIAAELGNLYNVTLLSL